MARQRYTVEAIRGDMIDVSTFKDLPNGGQFAAGYVTVELRNRAGTFGVIWPSELGQLPRVGDGIWITIERAAP